MADNPEDRIDDSINRFATRLRKQENVTNGLIVSRRYFGAALATVIGVLIKLVLQ